MKSIHMACDHAGIELKETLRAHLEKMGYTVTDHGTHSKESCDYPVFAHALCHAVEAEGVPACTTMPTCCAWGPGSRAWSWRLPSSTPSCPPGSRVAAISAASTSSMPSPGACHAALQYPYPQKGRIRPRPARKSQHVCLRHHRL